MKVEPQIDGTWLAQGSGPLRPVLTEGATRVDAMREYVGAVSCQIDEAREIDLSDFKWAWENSNV